MNGIVNVPGLSDLELDAAVAKLNNDLQPKVLTAVSGNLAAFDAKGCTVDSGYKPGGTPMALAAAAAPGSAKTLSLSDHVHPFPSQLATARNFSITGGATAAAVAFNGTADVALNVTAVDAAKLTGVTAVAHGGTGNSTGNAPSAVKLATARTINITGDTVGSVKFDGTADVTATVIRRGCQVRLTGTAAGTATWFKYASYTAATAGSEPEITFLVDKIHGGASVAVGILTAHLILGTGGAFSTGELKWLVAGSGIDPKHFVMAHTPANDGKQGVTELWVNVPTAKWDYNFTVLEEGGGASRGPNIWTITNAIAEKGAESVTAGYTTITSSLNTIKNTAANATTAGMVTAQALVANQDLNALKDVAHTIFYFAGGSNTVVNNPCGTGTALGLMHLRLATGYAGQMAFNYNGTQIYWRTGTASADSPVWSAWHKIYPPDSGTATNLLAAHKFSITGGATAAAVSFNGTQDVALNVTALDAAKMTTGVLAVKNGGTGNNAGKAPTAGTADTSKSMVVTPLAADIDFDAQLTTGLYKIPSTPTGNGKPPATGGGILRIANMTDIQSIYQEFLQYNGKTFRRDSNSGHTAWTVWRVIGPQAATELTGVLPVANGGTGNANGIAPFAKALSLTKSIAADQDYNALTTAGVYYSGNPPTGSNAPPSKAGGMAFVFTSGKVCYQEYIQANPPAVYRRRTVDGTAWNNWTLIGPITSLAGYLPLKGGTMTGNIIMSGASAKIQYKSTAATKDAITFYTGDANGSGIVIGGGGRVIVGSGESAESMRGVVGTAATNEAAEHTYVTADGNIYLTTNCNTIANRKSFTFGADGIVLFPGGANAASWIKTNTPTNTWLSVGQDGKATISSTAGAGAFHPFIKANGADGHFMLYCFQKGFYLGYMVNGKTTNALDKTVCLLDESGNATFPGTVKATTFSGGGIGGVSFVVSTTQPTNQKEGDFWLESLGTE